MKTIIIAPHPDDEWIGCGCTILKKLDENKKVKVLIITKEARTEKRIRISKALAKKYGYELKILGEKERKINEESLSGFLKKEIGKEDIVYIPDEDTHPDHKISAKAAKKLKNKKIQYCVYNNSLNMFRRIKNIVLYFLTGNAVSSFRKGKADEIFEYNLEAKNSNILKFGEVRRGGDVLRWI